MFYYFSDTIKYISINKQCENNVKHHRTTMLNNSAKGGEMQNNRKVQQRMFIGVYQYY